jgi:hypothetical protein
LTASRPPRSPLTTAAVVGGYPQTILREGDVVLVAECYEGQETYPAAFAPFIVATDPPAVLELIRRLRAAESR